jgi:tetratricopeptide (TPR) repeat protein
MVERTLGERTPSERNPARVTGASAVLLAWHFLEGDCPRDGLPFLDLALDHLERSSQNDRVIELADRALAMPQLLGGKRRVEVLLRRAECLGRLGRQQEAGEALTEAVDLADESGDRAGRVRGRLALGRQRWLTARYEKGLICGTEALRLAIESGDRKLEMKARWVVGNTLRSLGHYEDARKHQERTLALAQELDDAGGQAAATVTLGLLWEDLGDLAEAQQKNDHGIELAQEAGSLQWEASARDNLGRLFAFLGQQEQARYHNAQALALQGTIGDRWGEARSLKLLGKLAEQAGDLEEAEAVYLQALELQTEIGDIHGAACTLLARGMLELAAGRTDEANQHLRMSLCYAHDAASPNAILLATATLAQLHSEGIQATRQAIDDYSPRLGATARMEAHFLLWRVTGDPDHLEEAQRLLTRYREAAPADCRRTMIDNVPLHCEIAKARVPSRPEAAALAADPVS